MQKGFNSDIQVRGQSYHVQTEDWGADNPFLVSRIFRNGAVLKTIKTSRQQALQWGSINSREALHMALKKQHHDILEQLMTGEII